MQVSDFLFVPFRCPNCKDSCSFETLKELRLHLQTKHSDIYLKSAQNYKIGSNHPRNARRSPVLELFRADAVQIEENLKRFKESELNNKRHREEISRQSATSGLQSEMENSSRSRPRRRGEDKSTFRSHGHGGRLKYKYFKRQDGNKRLSKYEDFQSSCPDLLDEDFIDDSDPKGSFSSQDVKGKARPRSIDRIQNIQRPWTRSNENLSFKRSLQSLGNELDSHVQETLSTLSQEVVVGRSTQQATLDSLRSSQQIFSQLEQSAEDRVSRQQEIIASLTTKLSEKEEQMTDILMEMNTLKKKHDQELEKKKMLKQKSTNERERLLQEEITHKQKEMESLSERLNIARQAVMQYRGEIKEKKENALKSNNDVGLTHAMDNITKSNSELQNKKSVGGNKMNSRPKSDDLNLAQDVETTDDVLKSNSIPLSSPNSNQMSKDMTPKEVELIRLRSKSKQLENDRQTLLLEMQNLLETAASDNEKLRTELTNQGKQLSKLNLELERSKQEQSELLGETNTLYFQADLSLTRLKQMLEEKDGQLSTVTGQLEHAKDMQNKLIKEREDYLKLTEEKETRYRTLVQENALQLQSMKDSLNESHIEKSKLETKMLELKGELQKKEQHDAQMEERLSQMENQLSNHEDWQVKMLEQINDKEDRLRKAKISMEKMNTYLSDAADKELETRLKLEQFIANLVDRSAQAEAELQKMKVAYAAKVKSLTDTARNSSVGVSFDWARTSGDTKFVDRQISDEVFLIDEGHDDVSVDRYHTPLVNEELHFQTIEPKTQSSSTEMLRAKSNNDMNDYKNCQHMPNEEHYSLSKGNADRDDHHNSVMKEQRKEARSPPKRRIRNRPLLIQGKEFPSPDSYMFMNHSKPKLSTNEDKGKMSKSMDKLHMEPSLERKSRSGLSKYYVEKDGSDIEGSLPRKSKRSHAPKFNSSPERKFRNNSSLSLYPTTAGDENRVFRNTPEVKEMYRNVRKTMTGHKDKNRRQNTHRNRRLSNEFIMDDDGIIWESFDYSGLLKQKWTSQDLNMAYENTFGNKQNDAYCHETEQHSHEESEEDKKSPLRMKKSKQNKFRMQTESESPAPLGDKIVKVLSSLESSPLQSSARKEYSERMKNRQPLSQLLNNDEKPIESMTSDSLESSPVHRAQEVQKRIEKLTSSASKRVNSPQPAPRSRGRLTRYHKSVNDFIDENSPTRSGVSSVPLDESHHNDVEGGESDFSISSYASLTLDVTKKKSRTRNNTVSWFDNEDHEKEREVINEVMVRSTKVPKQNSIPLGFKENQSEEGFEAPDGNESGKMGYEDQPNYVPRFTKSIYKENEKPYAGVNEDQPSNMFPLTKSINEENGEPSQRRQSEEQVHSPASFSSQNNLVEKPWFRQSQSFDVDSSSQASNTMRKQKQASLKRHASLNDSLSTRKYDLVMKELIEKHPYLPKSEKEQHKNTEFENEDLPNPHESFESSRNFESFEIQPEESTDNGMLSSDEDVAVNDATDSFTKNAHAAESVEASTDTDLEKLARPGYMRKVGALRRKRRLMGKKTDVRSRQSKGYSDTANWTSTDTNDLEEIDQDDRWNRRCRRVALFCVLQYVDTETLLIASQVCKEWRKISHHPSLWKRVVLRNSSVGSEFLITMSQWCSQTESLLLTGLTGRPQKLLESEEDYHIATRGSLETGLERLLFACQGSLQTLTIEHCENILTDKCLWLISGNCRMLTNLCYRSADHPATPQLLWALGGGCPGITTLKIHPVFTGFQSGAMNNRFLLLIGQFYRDLQEIGLGGTEFDMAGLIPMIQSCQRLKVIHFDHCMALSDDLATAMCRAGLKDLESLNITGTNVHSRALQTLQKNCRHLRKISISLTVEDYSLDASKRKDRNTYRKLIQDLMDLQKKAGFSNLLTLEAEEVQ